MALASLLFAVMGALVKVAEARLPVGYAIFSRSAVGLVLSYLLVRRAGLAPRGKRPRLLAVRGAIGFTALFCTFEALARLPLAHATVILQTQPIWTAVAAAIFLREKAGLRVWLGCALALAGIVLVADPRALIEGSATGLDPLGVALALAASLLSAGAYVTVRALRRSDHPLVVVFWFALVATPASAPLVIANPTWPPPELWLVLLGIGLAVQAAQVLMTRALHREPAGRVAAVGYLQVVYAFVFGALFFDEHVEARSIVGALTVLVGALTVSIDWRRRSAANGALAGPSPRPGTEPPHGALDSTRRVG